MYINQNIKIRFGGRKAPKISLQDFSDLILNGIIKDKDNWEYLDIDSSDPNWIDKYIIQWKTSRNPEDNLKRNGGEIIEYFAWYGGRNTKLDNDFKKYESDWENREINSCGLTPNGIPYIELFTGGDWEEPICSYIYYDGKSFRGYIPEKGNCINRLAKAAFGNYRGDDILPITAPDKDRYDISKYSQFELIEFQKSDFYFLMSELFPGESDKLLPIEENWDIFYDKLNDLEIDWDKCREDFFARLEVI